MSYPGDYDGGGGEPFFEIFRLDVVPGVDGWTTPRQGALAVAERRFRSLERTCLIEHAADCVRSQARYRMYSRRDRGLKGHAFQ